jgi:hypothetical protein
MERFQQSAAITCWAPQFSLRVFCCGEGEGSLSQHRPIQSCRHGAPQKANAHHTSVERAAISGRSGFLDTQMFSPDTARVFATLEISRTVLRPLDHPAPTNSPLLRLSSHDRVHDVGRPGGFTRNQSASAFALAEATFPPRYTTPLNVLTVMAFGGSVEACS